MRALIDNRTFPIVTPKDVGQHTQPVLVAILPNPFYGDGQILREFGILPACRGLRTLLYAVRPTYENITWHLSCFVAFEFLPPSDDIMAE